MSQETNHTLEKTQWLGSTSLTFGNPFKIDPIQSRTPEVLHPRSSKLWAPRPCPQVGPKRERHHDWWLTTTRHRHSPTKFGPHVTLHFLIYKKKFIHYGWSMKWRCFYLFCYFVIFYFIVGRRWIWTLDVFLKMPGNANQLKYKTLGCCYCNN